MRKTIFICSLLAFSLGQASQAPDPEPDDWTHFLTDPRFMPAIKSCLAAHPQGDGPAVVMSVGHASRDEVSVMTTDLSGRTNACFASKDTGLVSQSRTVFSLPGPLFVSVDQVAVAPKGECIESTPVLAGQQLRGWLLRQPVLHHDIPSACSTPIWTGLQAQ